MLSTDNGKTWKRVLARQDRQRRQGGREVPRVKTDHAWIMIKALDNYFFDVSGKAFRIR